VELAVTTTPRTRSLAGTLRLDRRSIGAWVLGVAPVLYLALRGGGYDLVVYSEAGLAAWWVVLLGVVAGVLPAGKIARLGWVCLGLWAAFFIWTAVAGTWSESAQRTVDEVGRISAYGAFFVLGLCTVRRSTLRSLLGGLAVAFGVVSLLAVLSRLYPGSFPKDQLIQFFPGSNVRLDYPFNYANGTGEFLAIGIPLLGLMAARARTIAGQAIAAAALPLAVLGLVMTASRGAVVTAFVGIVIFYALVSRRLVKLLAGLPAASGATVLVVALLHRPALRHGLSDAAALTQRHQLALLALVTCAAVALVQAAVGLVMRYGLPASSLRVGRRPAAVTAAITAVLVIGIAVAAGVPATLSHQWRVFKGLSVGQSGDVYARLGTVAGSHRYQYWQAAVHAFQAKPLTGIGPGTFQFYWAQHGSISEHILNAHSLYLETLAETGVIGAALIVALLATILLAGIVRALRSPPLERTLLAGATAAFGAFCAAAVFDWVWQLPAIALAALLLGAGILGPRNVQTPERRRWPVRAALRGAVALVVLAAIAALAIPLGMTSAIRSSQAQARAGHLRAALADAATAQNLEPYAATPRLQRALLLEQLGDLAAARVAIAQAEAREPANWQIWLIAARIEAESGHARAAVRAFREAHRLDPRDPVTALGA
jgi:hypothetical protein